VLRLRISTEEDFTQLDSVVVPLGEPRILFVDDDGGRDYERFYQEAFSQGLVYTHSWDVKVQGSPAEVASNYSILIWSTGAERESTLTHEDQAFLREFLARGGALLVAGQNIGYDLILNGDREDSLFYAQVLRARLVADSADVYMTIGQWGDPIGERLFVYFQGSLGTPDPISPSMVEPLPPAVAFLRYAGRPTAAGIRWEDPQTSSRVVYLTFGLEAVRGPYEDSGAKLLARCIRWLESLTPVLVQSEPTPPTHLVLYPNYPNPFNPATVVRFELPRRERVRLSVYNLLGQRVRTLVDDVLGAGSHAITWDGRDVLDHDLPSGVYFLELRAGKRVLRQKAVKIR